MNNPYSPPATSVVEMNTEGVLCLSSLESLNENIGTWSIQDLEE